MKKFLAIVLCTVMTVSLVACTAKTEEPAEAVPETAAVTAAAANDKEVAIKVGDQEITVGDIQNAYNSYLEMYQYYGYAVPTEEADIEALQDTVVGELVVEKLKLYMAAQLGCDTLTEEQQKELDAQVASDEQSLLSYYKGSEDENLSEEELKEKAKEAINAELIANGWDMDYAGYLDYMRNYYKEGYVLENLEASVKSGAVVTDEKVQEYYDNLLSSQRTEIEGDPTAYLSTEMECEKNGGDPAVVVPEGYRRIKVIQFAPETELGEDYTSLQSQMAELEAEYGKNALAAEGDKARMQEIEKEYKDLNGQADGLYEEHIAEAKKAAEDACAKIEAGGEFDAVLKEVNPDSEYVLNPVIAEKGYLIYMDEDDGVWSDKVRESVKTLKDGDCSGVIQDGEDFYIIYLAGDEPAGEIPLEKVKELVKAAALEVAQDTIWEEKQEEWENDSSLVTKNEELYRGIGK